MTKSSTGGTIKTTKTGLIHTGDTKRFTTNAWVSASPVLKFDFTAFGAVKVPAWSGSRQIVRG
jgi:hypothetical protein